MGAQGRTVQDGHFGTLIILNKSYLGDHLCCPPRKQEINLPSEIYLSRVNLILSPAGRSEGREEIFLPFRDQGA